MAGIPPPKGITETVMARPATYPQVYTVSPGADDPGYAYRSSPYDHPAGFSGGPPSLIEPPQAIKESRVMAFGNAAPMEYRPSPRIIQETVNPLPPRFNPQGMNPTSEQTPAFPRGVPVAHNIERETRLVPAQSVVVSPVYRPDHYRELDKLHEAGHPDIDRYLTEQFKGLHDYLTDSCVSGRGVEGATPGTEVGVETEEALAKSMENISKDSDEVDNQTYLDNLVLLCTLSRLRNDKLVDLVTKQGFADRFKDVWQRLNQARNVNDQLANPGQYICVNLLLDAAQRFTEKGIELCKQMGKVIPPLLDFVRDPFFDVTALNQDDEELKWMSRRELLKKIFTIFYNCIRNHPDNRKNFRRHGASSILRPYLDCRFFILRAKALFILAYIVTEEENADLNTTSISIEFIVKILRRSLENPQHYTAHYNFFAHEVAEAVEYLAANDNNKVTFVVAGVLPYLVVMMDEKNSMTDRSSALNALWVLSFSSQNKDAIVQQKDCIDILNRDKEVEDLSKTCKAILWNVDELKLAETKSKDKDDEEPPEEGAVRVMGIQSGKAKKKGKPSKPQHVMLSYQWDVQKQIVRVKDILRAHGFNVWIDVEQMGGSTLEAMANAVEDACLVIICFSEKYKDSPSCRTEAEYTYKLRKPIIPLKMHKGYDPNGWLGAMIGPKLYIEMFTLDLVDRNIDALLRELGGRGRDPSAIEAGDDDDDDARSTASSYSTQMTGARPVRRIVTPPPLPVQPYYGPGGVPSPALTLPRRGSMPERVIETVERVVEVPVVVEKVVHVPSTTPYPHSEGSTWKNIVKQWDERDVAQWLGRNNYHAFQNWFGEYRGIDILGLKEMADHAPEFFYQKLESEFGFRSLLQKIRFKRMLDDIH